MEGELTKTTKKDIKTCVTDPTPPGHPFVLVSFEKSQDDTHVVAFKLRGTFTSQEEAEKYAMHVNKNYDNQFNIYVTTTGTWVKLPSKFGKEAESTTYPNEQINEMLNNVKQKAYDAQDEVDARREAAKQLFNKSHDSDNDTAKDKDANDSNDNDSNDSDSNDIE